MDDDNLKSWGTIPQELLDRVFQELQVSDFKQCQYTCRNWSQNARKYFYKSTKLTSAIQANAFVRATSNSTATEGGCASHLVKSLELNKEICTYPKVDSVLSMVLTACPNVIKLWSSKQKGPFWTKLLQEYYEGHCSHLTYLPHPKPNSIDTIQSYGYCIWAMRKTLKEICIFDYPTPEEGFKFKNQRDVSQLDEYDSLEKLVTYIKQIENIYQVPSIVRKNPKITSLEIVIDTTQVSREINDDTTDDDESVNNLFETVNYGENGIPIDEDDISISDILGEGGMHYINLESSPDPLPHIKSFRCDKLMPVNNGLINYLMHVFTGLESLHININEEFDKFPMGNEDDDFMMPSIEKGFERKMEMEGKSVSAQQWVAFLCDMYTRIPSLTISHLFVSGDISNVIGDFITSVFFEGTVNFRYKIDQTSRMTFGPYIGIYSQVDGVYFGKKESAVRDGNINVVFDSSFGCYEHNLPHMEILERVGVIFKSVEIDIHPGDKLAEHGTVVYNMITGGFIDHALRHCRQLSSICIRSAHLVRLTPKPQINERVKVLRLWGCFIVPSVLKQISARLPNLTYLIMNDCFFSSPQYDAPIINYHKSFAIDIPNTVLDTFYWSVPHNMYSASKFVLRVSKCDGQDVLNFTGDNSKVTRAPAKMFDDSLTDSSVFTIHIRCADVRTVMVFTPTLRIVIKPSQEFTFRRLTEREETHNFIKVLNSRFLS